MSITLGLFGTYHLTLIKGGTTTNEKIKRGDFYNAIKYELKKLDDELAKPDLTADRKTQLLKSKDSILEDQDTLKKMFRPGLWHNLKEIFAA
jgi:hypothetical protein